MPRESSPAFQFYVKEWRSSRSVQRMSFAERGMYLEMLCEEWEGLTLPDDASEVAALIATTDAQAAELVAAWPVLRRKFMAVESEPGRIINVRLEAVRREKRAWKKVAKKGGVARAEQAARAENGAFQPASKEPARSQQEHQQGASKDASGTPARQPAERQPFTSSATASASPTASASASARDQSARMATPIMSRNPHLDHAACDQTLSRCVPVRVHQKLSDLLAPKYNGDRHAAAVALKDWYPSVWATLPAEFVMGDAFKFWQGQFDAAFASPVNSVKPQRDHESEERRQNEAALAEVRRMDALTAGVRR